MQHCFHWQKCSHSHWACQGLLIWYESAPNLWVFFAWYFFQFVFLGHFSHGPKCLHDCSVFHKIKLQCFCSHFAQYQFPFANPSGLIALLFLNFCCFFQGFLPLCFLVWVFLRFCHFPTAQGLSVHPLWSPHHRHSPSHHQAVVWVFWASLLSPVSTLQAVSKPYLSCPCLSTWQSSWQTFHCFCVSFLPFPKLSVTQPSQAPLAQRRGHSGLVTQMSLHLLFLIVSSSVFYIICFWFFWFSWPLFPNTAWGAFVSIAPI